MFSLCVFVILIEFNYDIVSSKSIGIILIYITMRAVRIHFLKPCTPIANLLTIFRWRFSGENTIVNSWALSKSNVLMKLFILGNSQTWDLGQEYTVKSQFFSAESIPWRLFCRWRLLVIVFAIHLCSWLLTWSIHEACILLVFFLPLLCFLINCFNLCMVELIEESRYLYPKTSAALLHLKF